MEGNATAGQCVEGMIAGGAGCVPGGQGSGRRFLSDGSGRSTDGKHRKDEASSRGTGGMPYYAARTGAVSERHGVPLELIYVGTDEWGGAPC